MSDLLSVSFHQAASCATIPAPPPSRPALDLDSAVSSFHGFIATLGHSATSTPSSKAGSKVEHNSCGDSSRSKKKRAPKSTSSPPEAESTGGDKRMEQEQEKGGSEESNKKKAVVHLG